MTVSARGTFALKVLATPQLVFMIEDTCVAAVESSLREGQVTLGVRVHVEHLAPCRPGEAVLVSVLSKSRKGNRLAFTAEAHAGGLLIGRAEHERVIVDLKSFKARWML
ncbi:MAG: thioesterase [Rhizobiales bacterium]|nr:thioesterase [Hyphomicrobiales bacterium]